MLYEIAHRFPEDMIFQEKGPLISLYQPTHRSSPDNKQDPILFKNLIRSIENTLKQKTNSDLIDTLMKPLYDIKNDIMFWSNTFDGIAVFASPNKCVVYNLYTPVKALAIVADSYHLKPILQAFQSVDHYQILGLSRENFTLYQGNRFGFHEIKIDDDTPRRMKDVLGDQLSDSYLSHGSYAGTRGQTMYHGHSDVKEEIDKDTLKYFRYVDAFVLNNYSKSTKLPLILVSLKEYHSEFKKLSKNPYLLDEGIAKSFESIEMDDMQKEAQKIIEAIKIDKIQKQIDSFIKAKAESSGSSDLPQVVQAAHQSRVESVLIEENKIIPGKIDNRNGKIKFGNIDTPENDDILDDLAELVLLSGGTVTVLPKEKMPDTTGVAAIYRY